MKNPWFAPEFAVRINEAPVPAAMRASITSAHHQAALEGASRLELALANESLRWLDNPLLATDNPISFSLGYASDPLTQVFVGQIVGRAASFPSSGAPSVTITALDRIQSLQQGSKVRWFAIPVSTVGNFPLPDIGVGSTVALENMLLPLFEPVGAALSLLLGAAEVIGTQGNPGQMQKLIRKQEGESDYDFLSHIARENGWEMFVEHAGPLGGHQLRFMSLLDHLTPDLILQYGRNLIEFNPRVTNVGQIFSITAKIWVSQIKTEFLVTLGWDWDRMSLILDIAPGTAPLRQGPTDFLIEEPVTALSAPRRMIGELIPRLNRRLTGSGTVIGDPRIKPGVVLRLEGLGREFGGLYRVTSVSHTIDGSGYRTGFEVRKEIWFGSIPLPEQGAVPIQVRV